MKEIINLRKPREKHFENGDGTITAQMYDHDIHFLKDGKYEEIDNTLIEKDNHYENKNNEFKVIFDKDNNDLLDIHKEEHYLNISLKNKENLILAKNKETIEYKDLENNIDIDYKIIGNKVKESIILKDKTNIPEHLDFLIDTNLELKLKENKTIEASCNNKVIFTIDSAFMIDNKKEINRNITYEITKENNKYNLKLTLDKEWLEKEEREYPVIVDPTIINGQGENVYDTWISDGMPDNQRGNDDQMCWIGYFPICNFCRSLIKFPLPSIDKSYDIVNAKVYLNYIGFDTEVEKERAISIHKINSPWDEATATWNNTKGIFSNEIEEIFCPNRNIGDGQCSFNITNLVKRWFNGEENNGIMLKWYDENWYEGCGTRTFRFYSKESDYINGTTNRAYLTITYINRNGIKNYMSYTDLQFNNGVTNINNYNGNLNNNFYINKTLSNKLPIYLSVNYNTKDILSNQNNIALGWKFNYEEKIIEEQIDNNKYLKFIDSTNATYYFYHTKENEYSDEEALNFKIKLNADKCELIDKYGNKKIYTKINNEYLLTKIVDLSNNEININYNNGKIVSLKDANDEIINIAYNNNLITISSNYEITKINLNNNLLSSVETKVGITIFSYNNKNLISRITDINNSSISFDYYENDNFKVKDIKQYGFNNGIGKSLHFEYCENITTITDNKDKKTVYTFNNIGNLINTSLYTKGNYKFSDAYVNTNSYYNQENKKNKISTANSYRKYINNLLYNSGFEEHYTECNVEFDVHEGEQH